jgi:hypothetical protein
LPLEILSRENDEMDRWGYAFEISPALPNPLRSLLARDGMNDIIQFPATAPEDLAEADVDAFHAQAFSELESEINDLDRMGEIANDLIMRVSTKPESHHDLRLATFASHHLMKMLKKFRADYYVRFAGKQPAD